jgi:hypothetical protein
MESSTLSLSCKTSTLSLETWPEGQHADGLNFVQDNVLYHLQILAVDCCPRRDLCIALLTANLVQSVNLCGEDATSSVP